MLEQEGQSLRFTAVIVSRGLDTRGVESFCVAQLSDGRTLQARQVGQLAAAEGREQLQKGGGPVRTHAPHTALLNTSTTRVWSSGMWWA